MPTLPFVSIIMPIRNEADFIERSLGSVLRQDYPFDRMELLIVDGMSEDGTREIIQKVISKLEIRNSDCKLMNSGPEDDKKKSNNTNFQIRILDNPARIVPPAFNIGLRSARGEVIVRVDGHCEVATDFVRCCVEAIGRMGADCVGGPIMTVGETPSARAIALAQSSYFGVGGAGFRTNRHKGAFVDTLAFGAYRRQVFDRLGFYDEELVRNQDDEFNFRIVQSGGEIWLDPSIRSVYYSRASFSKLWRQYFQYGFYKVRVIQKRRGVASWRHLVPGSFILILLMTIFIALVTGDSIWGLTVAGPYAVAILAASLWAARKDWASLPYLPLAFLFLHFGFGLGFLWGLWHWRRKPINH